MELGGPVRQIGLLTGPPDWESISGLLEGSTNTGSGLHAGTRQELHRMNRHMALTSMSCVSCSWPMVMADMVMA
jgi:hypothetical protein